MNILKWNLSRYVFIETVSEGVDSIYLAEGRDKWQAFVNMAMDL
jgi:hypothetical protein